MVVWMIVKEPLRFVCGWLVDCLIVGCLIVGCLCWHLPVSLFDCLVDCLFGCVVALVFLEECIYELDYF